MTFSVRVATLVALVASSGIAQRSASASAGAHQGTGRTPVEAQPLVTASFKDALRDSALKTIASSVGYEIVYSKQFVRLSGRVTLRFVETPLGEAITAVLRGTGVIAKISTSSKSIFLGPADTTKPARTPGTLRGRITDSMTKAGISSVTIALAGSDKRRLSDEEGNFVITGLTPGKYLFTFRRLGYVPVTRTVAISDDEETTLSVMLVQNATTLASVVTTGSGDRQRYQVGNSIATIDADSVVASSSIRSLSDLLANRAPGLQVLRGSGAVGAPSRIRVRGISSIESSNAPIIMLDGVRISGDYTRCRDQSLPGCNDLPSRLDDIDPDIIESIDVLKGPAASTLFGSDAANGVIVIKTKRGRAGPTRWTFRADQGYSYQLHDYPVPVKRLGYPLDGGRSNDCSLLAEVDGLCVPIDSVVRLNLLADPRTSSVGRGRNSAINVDVSGGVATLQYYLSGGYTDQLGTARLPQINGAIISGGLGGDKLPEWMLRPNTQTNGNLNGRLTGQVGSDADFSLGVNFVRLSQRNGPDGLSGVLDDVRSATDTLRRVAGWETFNFERTQEVTRAIGNATGNWRPLEWLFGTLTYGWDFSLRDDRELNRRGSCLPFCRTDDPGYVGSVYSGRGTVNVHSFNLGTTVTRPVGTRIMLRTAAGGQYVRTEFRDALLSATDLAEGGTSVSHANGLRSSDEQGDAGATAGLYIDQSVALNDRLFLGAAIRRDVGSSLGTEVAPLYPKWSLSWVASQEEFFPWKNWMSLRIRTAFGHAGVQPASTARLQTFGRYTSFVDSMGNPTGSYALVDGVGNPDLRPERSVEREGGFEIGVLGDRLTLDMTWFRKFTQDAVVQHPLAPSLGFEPGQTVAENIGNVLNTGTEATITALVIDRPNISWSMNVGYASRRNKLIALGRGVEPFSGGDITSQYNDDARIIEGYPLFGRWARPIVGYSDVNGDGIIARSEVRIGDSLVFIGPSEAKYDLGIHQNVGLLGNRVRLGADFQYVNGLVQLNRLRADHWHSFAAAQIPGAASLQEQAYLVAGLNGSSSATYYGFFEKVNFLRFTTASLSYTLPPLIAQRFRSQSATVSLLATNLGVWTNYQGRDPDVNTADAAGNQYFNGTAFPQPRTWSARVNLTF